jgi:hypothetical protein
MIVTAWQLGGGHYIPARVRGTAWEPWHGTLVPARSRLCKWAHTLGHGGHYADCRIMRNEGGGRLLWLV